MRKERDETPQKKRLYEQGRKERKGERETLRREGSGEGKRRGEGSLRTLLQATHLYMMLCRMEAKGVMPMPAPMSTACSEAKILRVGVP